jgi:hypothetical protein
MDSVALHHDASALEIIFAADPFGRNVANDDFRVGQELHAR